MGVPISFLPAASALTGAELLPVVQSGQTKRTTTDAIPYVPAGTGAVATTVQAKLRESVSVMDFGAVGNGIVDDTTAIKAAIAHAELSSDPGTYGSNSPASGSCVVFFPSGYYKITDKLTITKKITILGEGQSEFTTGSRILQNDPNKDIFYVAPIASGMSFAIEKMVLRHNGSGTGIMVNVTKTSAYCNSQRYVDCTFGPPASIGAKIIGDDVVFQNCLFDVGSGSMFIQLGTTTSGEGASNVRISNCDFYDPADRAIGLANVSSLTISGCTIYGDARTNTYFLDSQNLLATNVKNIAVTGCVFRKVRSIAALNSVDGFTFTGNVGSVLGAGAGEPLSAISFTGTSKNVAIIGNTFSGSYDTSPFFNDNGNTLTGCNLSGNSFENTGGVGKALSVATTSGVIANNVFTGFVTPSVSEKVQVTYSGATLSSVTGTGVNATVTNASEYDHVELSFPYTNPMDVGVFATARVSAANTVTTNFYNPTAVSRNVAAHTHFVTVTRGT